MCTCHVEGRVYPCPIHEVVPLNTPSTTCTCWMAWHGVTSPPPCQAHGHIQITKVTC